MKKIILLIMLGLFSFIANAKTEPLMWSSKLSVSFENGSAQFKPNGVHKSILQDAHRAVMVTVSGRTSTDSPSIKDERLALLRALSARKWLIAHGVSPMRVMINFVSANDYITENVTKEGKYINQRVDIELIIAAY